MRQAHATPSPIRGTTRLQRTPLRRVLPVLRLAVAPVVRPMLLRPGALLVMSLLASRQLLAQGVAPLEPLHAATAELPAWADSFVVVRPGARYARHGWSRLVLGERYRDLWNTPIRVPVLNLSRYAGGLTLTKVHAGSQTRSLRFSARNGRTYQFRAIDKDPIARLSEDVRHSVAGALLQDGVSSSHPAAALVASALLEAAGVLHVTPVVARMPDDAALGEHRAAFAGLLGIIEERPDETDNPATAFAGAERIISPERLFERLDRRSSDRVDARAFLRARLVDILMGDRDRHRDQFRWLARDSGSVTWWHPISRDHDEAFVKIDGAALAIIRLYYLPLVTFGVAYPAHDKLNWHAREIDRRFLVGLDRPAWDSVALDVQRTLSDSVIDAAVQRMPPEMVAVGGATLARVLKARRDGLLEQARSYRAFLGREVELRGTNAADVAVVTFRPPDSMHVMLRSRGDDDAPFLQRTFVGRETREVRLLMWGGKDSVLVHGRAPRAPLLRIVGGSGADVIVGHEGAATLRIYDEDASTVVGGAAGRVSIDRRAFPEWVGSDLDRYPPRDWGSWTRPLPVLGASSDHGLVVGAGVLHTTYGFRAHPYASHVRATLSYATAVAALRGEVDADLRRSNSSLHLRLHGLASGTEVLRYFGQGNKTRNVEGRDFHTVRQTTLATEPRVQGSVGRWGRWSVGPSVRWTRSTARATSLLASIADTLYGAGSFGLVGAGVELEHDSRDESAYPTQGSYLRLAMQAYPTLWDARHPFSVTAAEWRGYRTGAGVHAPTLALRLGGQLNAGRYPFQQSAFLGGNGTVRGLHQQRYAGDASLYASAESRVIGGRATVLLPMRWGGYAGVDAGRVWTDGASPGGWHAAAAAGAWLSVLERANTVRLGLARSRERFAFEAGIGLAF